MGSSRLMYDIQAAIAMTQREPEKIPLSLSNLSILLPPLRRHWRRAVSAALLLLVVSLLALPLPYVQKIIFDFVLPSGNRVLLVQLLLALFGMR